MTKVDWQPVASFPSSYLDDDFAHWVLVAIRGGVVWIGYRRSEDEWRLYGGTVVPTGATKDWVNQWE